MTEQLPGMESERRKPELSQWYTPNDLAEYIADFALEHFDAVLAATTMRVLEPSAGRGALAVKLRERVRRVTCCEVDVGNADYLMNQGFGTWRRDFLELEPSAFDLVVMNPPFEGGQTERHILHALKFAPRVVCHCPLSTLAGQKRKKGLWSEAYLKRVAICSERPRYGGEGGGKTDMCTVEVTRRFENVRQDDVRATGVTVEWW